MTPEILLKLVYALPHTSDSYFSRTLLHAMFNLAYCAFLRVGEITKINSKTHHYLLAKHVSKGIDANGLGFVDIAIPHFKHSKSNFYNNSSYPKQQKSFTMSISSTYQFP